MENVYFLGINESSYRLFLKDGTLYWQDVCQNTSFEVLTFVNRIFSACPYENEKAIIFYGTKKDEVCAAIIEKGKAIASMPLLNMPYEKAPLCGYFGKKIYIITPYQNFANIYAISPQSPYKETIFNGCAINEIKLCSIFPQFAAALTPKGIELYLIQTGTKERIAEKNLHCFSLCSYNGASYIAAASRKNVFLYIWKNGSVDKFTLFTGNAIENCSIFIKEGVLYVCALSEGKIYYRCCPNDSQGFSSMGSLPLYQKCLLKNGFFAENDTASLEFYASENKPLSELYPFLYRKKIIVENHVNEANKTLIETLSKDISAMSSQNSMLNLKYKAVQDKYISQIDSLMEKNKLLEDEVNTLRESLEKAKKDLSHMSEENALLKKTKKLLEDEIYSLNSSALTEENK